MNRALLLQVCFCLFVLGVKHGLQAEEREFDSSRF